jgi:hypothetical protein
MNYGPLEFAAHLRRKAAHAPAVAPRSGENRLTIISGPRSLRRTVREEAVSVFEAIVSGTGMLPRVGKPVRVTLHESRAPMVLVLSSQQAVTWRVDLRPGARLLAVLLAGCGESRVSGAGDAVVQSIGGDYAFRRGSGEFRHLEDEVRRATGCAIGRFESASAATEFQA